MQDLPLGAIRLLRPWSRGGHGEVWRGTLRGLPVAVKLVRGDRQGSGSSGTGDAGEALLREVRALAALDHPHIVPIYDHGRVPRSLHDATDGRLVAGTPWMALAWAEAGSLSGLVGALPFDEIRRVLLEVLDALAAAHADGLLHLDLKPGNVLLGPGGHTWLADFGLARGFGEGSGTRTAGTPASMSPEQVNRATRQLGPWTDLYALGCLGWQLATGRSVFRGSTATDVLRQHQTREPGRFSPVVPVPEAFEVWLRTLLSKAPEDRFRHAAEASAALKQVAGPLVATPAPAERTTSSAPTFALDDVTAEEVAPTQVPPEPRTQRPFPTDPPVLARRLPPPLQVAEAVPRLLALRRPPTTAPRATCHALWAHLDDVRLGARSVSVQGPAAEAAVQWLTGAARRSGAARVVTVREGHHPVRDALREALALGDPDDPSEAEVSRQLSLYAPGHWSPLRVTMMQSAVLGRCDPLPALLQVLAEIARVQRVIVAATAPTLHVDVLARNAVNLLWDQPVLVVCAGPLPDGAEHVDAPSPSPHVQAAWLDGIVPTAPQLKARLAGEADPSAAHWVLRHLAATGALRRTEHGLDGAVVDDPIAEMLALVEARHPSHRRRLQLLAALGTDTPVRTWRRACRADVGWDPEVRETCAGQGLLVERGERVELPPPVRARVLAGARSDGQLAALHAVCAEVVPSHRAAEHHGLAGHPERGLALLEAHAADIGATVNTAVGSLFARWKALAEGLDPDTPEVRRGRALWSWLLARSHDDEPEDGLDDEARAWVCLGVAHRRRFAGDAEASAQAARTAELAAHGHPELQALAWWAQGMAALLGRDMDTANAALERAAELGHIDSHLRLAASALHAHDPDTAQRWLDDTPREHLRWFQAGQWLVLDAACARQRNPPDGVRARQGLEDAERMARATHRDLLLYVVCNRIMDQARAGVRPDVSGLATLQRDTVPLQRRAWIQTMALVFGDAPPDLRAVTELAGQVPSGPVRDDLADLLQRAADADPRWEVHRPALEALAASLQA